MHYMGKGRPKQVSDPDVRQKVFDWKVPLVVDGRKGSINGDLLWTPPPEDKLPLGAIFAFAGLVIALSIGVFVIRRRRASAAGDGGGLVRRGRSSRRCSRWRWLRRARARTPSSRAPRRSAARGWRSAPGEVTLRFGEPVEASFGAVRVFDHRGREVQAGAATHPGGHSDRVAVKLRPGLGQGGYTVTYRVISADSHPVSGGFVFSVGDGAAPAATVDELLAGGDSGPGHLGRVRRRARGPVRGDRARDRGARLPAVGLAARAAGGGGRLRGRGRRRRARSPRGCARCSPGPRRPAC